MNGGLWFPGSPFSGQMRRRLAAVGFATMCTFAVPLAAASPVDGRDWLARCDGVTTASDSETATYCFSYARGLADGLSIWAIMSPTTAYACIPTEVQSQRLLDVGTRFVKSHPDMQQLAAGVLLTYSFVESWPCNAAQPSSATAN